MSDFILTQTGEEIQRLLNSISNKAEAKDLDNLIKNINEELKDKEMVTCVNFDKEIL